MKKIVNSEKAPQAIGPYSQAIEQNGTLFISGQIPIDRTTGNFISGGIKEQTEQVLKNIGYILEAAGYDYSQVVKTTCFLSEMVDFSEMNEVYATFFTEKSPARAAVSVKGLPKGALIEIEAIAMK